MSQLACLGLSHRSAELTVRERFAVTLAELPALLTALRAAPGVAEAAVLSTCNRVEVYVAAHGGAALPADDALWAPLLARAGGELPGDAVYVHREHEAARHLFRVATGLDSLVVGETEILGQVREAYGAAAAADATGRRLNPLFQQALATARRLHAGTRIGAGRVSVAGVAVDLARRVFGALGDVHALLAGTGETGRLALRHLRDAGVGRVSVASRDPARAAELAAQVGAQPVPSPIGAAGGADALALAEADLWITAMGDAAGAITSALVRDALRARKQRPVVVIDLGVPRNAESGVGGFDNVYYYDVDDLERVVQANLRGRTEEVAACEAGVTEAVEAFWKRHGDPDVERSLAEIAGALNAVGEEAIATMLGSLGGLEEPERARVLQAARKLVNRLLHRPLSAIQEAAANGGAGELTGAARRLFDLDGVEGGEESPEA